MNIVTSSHVNHFSNPPVVSHGKISVYTDSCKVTYDGQIINLNPKQYNLLLLFLRYPNHVLSYEVIIDRLWEIDKYPTQNVIRSHIKGLRKAFNKIDDSVQIIETVHGLGYRLKPLEKDTYTNFNIFPSLSLLKGFFKAKAIEYLVINEEMIVKYISPGLPNYCDYPEFLKVGVNAEDAFPEFIGLEEVFKTIVNQEEANNYELKSIARAANPNRPEYINLYVMRDEFKKTEKIQDKVLFIFFEDASETTLYRQRLVQLENEFYLKLEVEKRNN